MSVLLTGALIATGAVGLGAHASASEKNGEASRIRENAKRSYEEEQVVLEEYKKNMEQALLDLGYLKKSVLESSVRVFVEAYERIKDIEIKDSAGIDELGDFSIDEKGVTELQRMDNVYSSTLSGLAAGAATGYVMALAVSGSLSIVTEGLAVAGSALAMGELGLAAGIAGSALSIGTLMSPIGVAAAPILLFTGLSADSNADANIDRANVEKSKVNEAIAEMRVVETMYNAISRRAGMLQELLIELNEYFTVCSNKLNTVTLAIKEKVGDRGITADDIMQGELELIAVTRALAGAVKAVIDTPMLNENSELTPESLELYQNTQNSLPGFRKAATGAKNLVFCPSCGNKISPRAKTCPKCGAEK